MPATNEPMAAVASACAPRPRSRHRVAVERRHHRAASPGVFSRIDVVEPPYMRAVIDAREHDERRRRIQTLGHRQQQRDGRSAGPMPGRTPIAVPNVVPSDAQNRL